MVVGRTTPTYTWGMLVEEWEGYDVRDQEEGFAKKCWRDLDDCWTMPSDVSPSFATEAARGEQLFYPLSFLTEGMSHILFSAAIQFEIYPSFSAPAPF